MLGTIWTRLIVVQEAPPGVRNKKNWLVICLCGSQLIVPQNGLRTGNTRSCGCLQREAARLMGHRNRKALGASAFKILMDHYIKSARDREIPFSLRTDEFRALTSSDCHYCGIPPKQSATRSKKVYVHGDYLHNGIDRKDNSLGYELSNCLPCCKICNYAKRTLSYEEFQQYIRRLIAFCGVKCETLPRTA